MRFALGSSELLRFGRKAVIDVTAEYAENVCMNIRILVSLGAILVFGGCGQPKSELLAKLSEVTARNSSLNAQKSELESQVKQLQKEIGEKDKLIAESEKKMGELTAVKDAIADKLKNAEIKISADAQNATKQKWGRIVDQIILKLERVSKEPANFTSARLVSDLDAEVARLKSLVRQQESAARELVLELKANDHPDANYADQLVKDFAENYIATITFDSLSWRRRVTLGNTDEKIEAMRKESRNNAIIATEEIYSLRYGPRDPTVAARMKQMLSKSQPEGVMP